MTTSKKEDSFLHETQVDGKGKQSLTKKDLDQAIAEVSFIINPEAAKELHGKKTEEVNPIKMSVYCHDCRALVPAGIGKGRRGKMRTVCGSCTSRKISSGRKEALESFYHIKEHKEKAEHEKTLKKEPKKYSKKKRN